MAKVLVLVDDLFFGTRIAETARHVGVELEAVSTGNALVEKALPDAGASSAAGAQRVATQKPALIVVDLNARTDALDALTRLQAAGNQTPVVAFLSHVQTELAERARAAGCSEVMPRSRFTQELAAILGRAKT
jgi:CheY-like chemotaxis protein